MAVEPRRCSTLALQIAGVLVVVPVVALALQPSADSAASTYSTPTSSRVAARITQPAWLPAARGTAARTAPLAAGEQSAEVYELELGQRRTGTESTQAAGVWAIGAGLLALLSAVVRAFQVQKLPVLAPLLETKVDERRFALAAATAKKPAKPHDYALIVTNKGGGHGEIAFHLALALRAKGVAVQIINDNGGKDVSSKPPFSQYGQLLAAGVEVAYADLSQPGALQLATCPPEHLCRAYDYIFDNENVCPKEVAELATQCGAFYTYVSSGGMYIPGDKFPMKESNPSKKAESNDQRKHELYVMSEAVRPKIGGCAFFRPQYIVGPYTNKRDYLDWFFDRLTRNLPVPIPAPGTQTTTITDVRDVANMIASVVGQQEAIAEAEKANAEVGPVFNCASDRPVSLRQIVMACGAACGKTEAETAALIRLYDPTIAKGAPSGGKFPFRDSNFDVGVDKAKVVLGWEAEYNDFEDIAIGYYEGYKALGLDKKNPKMDTAWDEYILARI